MTAGLTGLSIRQAAIRMMPDLTGMSLRLAVETLAGMGLNCQSPRGGPRVTRQEPEPGTPIAPGDRCALLSE